MPLFVSWAANNPNNVFQLNLAITGGSVEHDLVTVEDIVPTILATAETTVPEMDGYDLSPYLRSQPGVHRPQQILRHMPHEHRSNYFSWYRDGDWKILYRYDSNLFELYNLASDPDESDNLASAQPDRVLTMARAMARELQASWGIIYGALWPTHNPAQVATPARPLTDDPFFIDFSPDGRDAIDSDGDNINDGNEVALGLDPLDPGSYFYLHASPQAGGTLALTWPSKPGTSFEIRGSGDLADWSEVVIPDVPASAGTSTSYTLPPSAEPRKFYRVGLK